MHYVASITIDKIEDPAAPVTSTRYGASNDQQLQMANSLKRRKQLISRIVISDADLDVLKSLTAKHIDLITDGGPIEVEDQVYRG